MQLAHCDYCPLSPKAEDADHIAHYDSHVTTFSMVMLSCPHWTTSARSYQQTIHTPLQRYVCESELKHVSRHPKHSDLHKTIGQYTAGRRGATCESPSTVCRFKPEEIYRMMKNPSRHQYVMTVLHPDQSKAHVTKPYAADKVPSINDKCCDKFITEQ